MILSNRRACQTRSVSGIIVFGINVRGTTAVKVLTHLELSQLYAGDRPQWQHEANAKFFEALWHQLQMGGLYAWPGALKLFKKVPGGWEEVPTPDFHPPHDTKQ